MSVRGVEIVLGRLATDEVLRQHFQESPRAALGEMVALGVELSELETAALEALDAAALLRFARALDGRLRRAAPVSARRRRTE